jgi:hypothetical protein
MSHQGAPLQKPFDELRRIVRHPRARQVCDRLPLVSPTSNAGVCARAFVRCLIPRLLGKKKGGTRDGASARRD